VTRWSQIPQTDRDRLNDYISERWTQLSDSSGAFTDEGIKFLLAVNGAGVAGALSFIGTMSQLRGLLWPKVVLALFATGLAFLALFHLARHHRTAWLFKCWRDKVQAFKKDEFTWQELYQGDLDRSVQFTWPLDLSSHGSLVCFLAAVLIAGANFGDITAAATLRQEAQSEQRKENTTAPAAVSTDPKRGTEATAAAKGRPAGAEQSHSTSQQTTAGSGSAAQEAQVKRPQEPPQR
jgi:hypothetical protein